MRIRYNPEARPELAAWEYYIDEPEKLRGHWAEQFARRQPMVLELGCGKGGFLAQMAPAHPEKNYIALDVKSEMLVLATGCVVACVTSLAAIRFLMNYVRSHDFKVFGFYRIALGVVVLAASIVGFI